LFHLQSQLLNLRHSLTTRFLLTCISSYFFDGENTLDDLHEVMAADATFLYEKGITAPLKNDLLLIFIIWPLHFQGSLWACLTLNQTKKKLFTLFVSSRASTRGWFSPPAARMRGNERRLGILAQRCLLKVQSHCC
jgi:hypothetical protein